MIQTNRHYLYLPLTLHKAYAKLYECRQGKAETCNNYLSRFLKNLRLITNLGGHFGEDMILVHFEMELAGITVDIKRHKPGNDIYDKYVRKSAERYKTTVFIFNADEERFRQLQVELRDSYYSFESEKYATIYKAFQHANQQH